MAHPAFDFEVITPDGSALHERVTSVRLPGKDGSFGILARHAPLLAALEAGPLLIEREGGKRDVFVAGDGFVEVTKVDGEPGGKVRALVDFLESKEEIDVARAKEAEKRARERLKSREEHFDVARAEAALRRAIARLSVAQFPALD
jgi:F-type H+-transporting ATPase subunit epsilon